MNRIILLLAMFVTLIFAEDVTVEGIAVIKTSKENAKKEALLDAKIKAIESVIGTYIKSQTKMKDYEIQYDVVEEKLEGFISKYKVIDESVVDGIFKLKINASVKKGKINLEIDNLTSHLNYNKNPRFMIISKGDKVISSIFESQIKMHLLKNKINVVELNQLKGYYQDILSSTTIDKSMIPFSRIGVDYIIYTDISRQNIDTLYKGEKHNSIRLYINTNVTSTSTMEVLVQKTYPNKASDNKIIIESALISDIKEISNDFGKNLLISINDKWNEQMFNGENTILEIEGLKDLKALQILKEYFSEIIPSIKSIYEKSFNDKNAVLDIKIQGGVDKFADELIFNNDKYEIKVKSKNRNQLKIEVK